MLMIENVLSNHRKKGKKKERELGEGKRKWNWCKKENVKIIKKIYLTIGCTFKLSSVSGFLLIVIV